MRSFPHAWVFPGGSVDATDDSLESAIAREIWEETGLKVDESSSSSLPSTKAVEAVPVGGDETSTGGCGWTIESIWESVFPTIPEQGVTIKRHHLVVYLSMKLSEREMSQLSLKLCDEEVDGAVWLSPENVNSILAKSSVSQVGNEHDDTVPEEEIWVDLFTSSNNQVTTKSGAKESLKHLSGIYPRFDHDDTSSQHPYGMAQGSLFALQE
jgi:8-oxo-dGTP pyrophosphatase MutT (NUDIX family)